MNIVDKLARLTVIWISLFDKSEEKTNRETVTLSRILALVTIYCCRSEDENDDTKCKVEVMLSTSWGQLRSSYKSRRPTTIAISTIYAQISQFPKFIFPLS